MTEVEQIDGPAGTQRGRELRMKAIKEALVEFVTGKQWEDSVRRVLADNGCDPSEIDALLRSAPKTIKRRTCARFKGEVMNLDLVGGAYPKQDPEAA